MSTEHDYDDEVENDDWATLARIVTTLKNDRKKTVEHDILRDALASGWISITGLGLWLKRAGIKIHPGRIIQLTPAAYVGEGTGDTLKSSLHFRISCLGMTPSTSIWDNPAIASLISGAFDMLKTVVAVAGSIAVARICTPKTATAPHPEPITRGKNTMKGKRSQKKRAAKKPPKPPPKAKRRNRKNSK